MICTFCNNSKTSEICKNCVNNTISKTNARNKYGLSDAHLSKLNSIKKGSKISYIENDVKKLFNELTEKLIIENSEGGCMLKKKKLMIIEDEKNKSVNYKKHIIKKLLAIYLEKSNQTYVALYSDKISLLISSYLNSSLSPTEIASGICFEIEKCIARDKIENDIKLKCNKISSVQNNESFVCENIVNPIKERINNIDNLIYKNFDAKHNSSLKKSNIYKQYIDGKIYSANDALMKMREIIHNSENRNDKLYTELEKYGIIKSGSKPYKTEKYFENYFNNNAGLNETIKNIVKTRDFWRIVFLNYGSSNIDTKYISSFKNMFMNDKISDDGLVREFVSTKIRMSNKGWHVFKEHHVIKHSNIDIHLIKKIDDLLFRFFDSEEIDLLLENMKENVSNYIFKRCSQLTFKCKVIHDDNNKITYDISKPINLMGDKL